MDDLTYDFATNPIYVVWRRWDAERNRARWVWHRVVLAVVALAMMVFVSVPVVGQWIVSLIFLLTVLSLFVVPPVTFEEDPYIVPDRFMLLLAQASELDPRVKAAIARQAVATNGRVLVSFLRELATKLEGERELERRTQAEGFRALSEHRHADDVEVLRAQGHRLNELPSEVLRAQREHLSDLTSDLRAPTKKIAAGNSRRKMN